MNIGDGVGIKNHKERETLRSCPQLTYCGVVCVLGLRKSTKGFVQYGLLSPEIPFALTWPQRDPSIYRTALVSLYLSLISDEVNQKGTVPARCPSFELSVS